MANIRPNEKSLFLIAQSRQQRMGCMPANTWCSIPDTLESQTPGWAGLDKTELLYKILLYGTRRSGKTTIIEHIANKYNNVLLLQGEDMQVADLLQQRTVASYQQLTREKKIIIIDEAQAVPNIGKILKLMIDNIKGITIIATGSSSFDLVYHTGEPLVGRNVVYRLYPIAQTELSEMEDRLTTLQNLEQQQPGILSPIFFLAYLRRAGNRSVRTGQPAANPGPGV